ncbi:MAG: hypothetical protein NVSMB51_13940 [Solirubrobacteraceae bacterium]
MHKTTPLLITCAALALGACGSSSGGSIQAAPSGGAASSQQAPSAPTPMPPASGPLSQKPQVAKGTGAVPAKLEIKDLIPGKGAAAASGQSLTVEYVGVLWRTGKQFDASWDRAKAPFSFTLGAGSVIPGWDKGLIGMKVGGRRELIIPAALAYGPQGRPPAIPANSPLIFDIDLLAAS